MNATNRPRSGIGSLIFRNVAVLATFWLTAGVLVRVSGLLSEGWAASDIAITIAAVLGVFGALRMSARFAAYFLASQVAFAISELIIHGIYGIRTVQGGPTHFAVMGAGALGVLFGIVLGRGKSANAVSLPAKPNSSVSTESESAVAETQVHSNHPRTALGASGT